MSISPVYSLLYRCLDSIEAAFNPGKRHFRRQLLATLKTAKTNWESADYGSGYLYQTSARLGLRGFRKTEARVKQMALDADLLDRAVLEIGCNTGFLSLELARGTRRYVAFDMNPFLVEIGKMSQDFLGGSGIEFQATSVELFKSDQAFDVVLSFANHSTWDGNMTLPLEAYFRKLQAWLVPGGLLCFESHHPALENKVQVQETLKVMQMFFAIEEQKVLNAGSAWDRGRTFVKARSLR